MLEYEGMGEDSESEDPSGFDTSEFRPSFDICPPDAQGRNLDPRAGQRLELFKLIF